MNGEKRKANERKFGQWEKTVNGGRRYWYEVAGHLGWLCRYVKVVSAAEETLQFYQEIYNAQRELVEVHEKYPQDRGHHRIVKE